MRSADNGDGGVDLTNAELTGPLRNGAFVNACNAPSEMRVTIKVAIRDGAPVGVTVATNPQDASVARCIDSAVRRMSWPKSPHLNLVTTTF